MLSNNEKIRYKRQLDIQNWGTAGQERLQKAHVFVAGVGGLGAPVIYYLAAAGVGTITVCDNDNIQLSNLNRQILHNINSIGQPKSESAYQTINNFNPGIAINPINKKITESNITEIITDAQLIIDCVDNFKTRFFLNQFCINKNIPMIHAGVEEFRGQVTFINPPETACLACIFPDSPTLPVSPSITGATTGVIGSLQAVEALKFLTGLNNNLKNTMLCWDGLIMKFTTINLSRNLNCPVCSKQYKEQ